MLPILFFMVMLVASRIVCQGGLPYFTITAAPTDGMTGMFGSRFLGQAGLLAAVVMQKVLFVDVRESIMPSLFHGAKLGERARNQRMLLLAIAPHPGDGPDRGLCRPAVLRPQVRVAAVQDGLGHAIHSGGVRERPAAAGRAHRPQRLDARLRGPWRGPLCWCWCSSITASAGGPSTP